MKVPKSKFNVFDTKIYSTSKSFVRPGSLAILQAPSRINKTLFYPDGRIVKDSKWLALIRVLQKHIVFYGI